MLFILAFFLMPVISFASCTSSIVGTATVSLPSVIAVSKNTKAGDVLFTSPWVSGTKGKVTGCGGWSANWDAWTVWSASYALSAGVSHDVYQTGIPGIGVRVQSKVNIPNTTPWGTSAFYITGTKSTTWGCGAFGGNCEDPYNPESNYQIDIVATAAGASIQKGTASLPSPIASVNFHQVKGTQLNLTSTSIVFKTASCDFTTQPGLTFTVGNIAAGTFTGQGSLSAAKAADNAVEVTCDAGTSMNITLTGTADAYNTQTVALSSTSTAKGVGVQFLLNDQLMTLNTPITKDLATASVFTLPLKARYVQTLGSITAGSANATAILQITYN